MTQSSIFGVFVPSLLFLYIIYDIADECTLTIKIFVFYDSILN